MFIKLYCQNYLGDRGPRVGQPFL